MTSIAVELIPAKTTARPGDKLPYTLVNNGPGAISFGTPYSLDRDHDGQWIGCNIETAWTAQLIGLRPGGRHESAANIPDDAAPGRYRVSKKIEDRATGEKSVVDFEFNVTAA